MKITWSWNVHEPKAQTQAKTKYISYHSLGHSLGTFAGTSNASNKVQSIWMWAISGIGVIFLNLDLEASNTGGIYLSNKISKFAFSDSFSLVSIQLVTYLKRKH